MPQDRPTSSSAKMISRSSIGRGNGNSNKRNSTVNCSGMNIQPRYGVRIQDEVVAMRSPLGFFGGFSETSHWSQNLRRHRTQALGLGFYPRSRWGCNDSSSERFPNTSLIATSLWQDARLLCAHRPKLQRRQRNVVTGRTLDAIDAKDGSSMQGGEVGERSG